MLLRWPLIGQELERPRGIGRQQEARLQQNAREKTQPSQSGGDAIREDGLQAWLSNLTEGVPGDAENR
jgi:hypothetical protein